MRLLIAAIAALLWVGCNDISGSTYAIGPVDIVVALDDAERWTATGPPVEDGLLCAAGRRHHVGYEDPNTGEPLRHTDYVLLLQQAPSPLERPDVIVVVEHTCDDGSGSFVAAENPHRQGWDLRSGTAAYRSVSGSGTVSLVADRHARPAELHIAVAVWTQPAAAFDRR